MIVQAARLIVVVAFSRTDNDELVEAYDPMHFDVSEGPVRLGRSLTAEGNYVLVWDREVQPDTAAYGAVPFQCGEVPEME